MEVDVHEIMTTLFNVELNEFLAKFEKYKVFEKIQTGGLMEIRSRETHQFYVYVQWLNDFREQLYRKSTDFRMELESFQREMDSLLELYVHLKLLRDCHVFSENAEKDLDEYFLKPFMRFLNKLDEMFGSFFGKKVNDILSKAVDITVKVSNVFNTPISNVEVQISYVRFPRFEKYAKTYPLLTLKTDDEGYAKILLLRPHEGGYRVDVKKYNKFAFLDVNSCNYVEIKVFDLLNLLRYKISKFLRKL